MLKTSVSAMDGVLERDGDESIVVYCVVIRIATESKLACCN